MDDANGSNFGNADGGGIVDVADNAANSVPDASAGNGNSDPAAFVKRGRGRPRKDGGNAESAGSAGQQAGKGQSKKATKLDVGLFARQIQGVHAMLALVTKNPVWNIEEKAAESLAAALLDVMSHHSINIDPASMAYMKLAGVCAMIYGPKLLVLKQQSDAKKRQQDNTIDMPQ